MTTVALWPRHPPALAGIRCVHFSYPLVVTLMPQYPAASFISWIQFFKHLPEIAFPTCVTPRLFITLKCACCPGESFISSNTGPTIPRMSLVSYWALANVERSIPYIHYMNLPMVNKTGKLYLSVHCRSLKWHHSTSSLGLPSCSSQWLAAMGKCSKVRVVEERLITRQGLYLSALLGRVFGELCRINKKPHGFQAS